MKYLFVLQALVDVLFGIPLIFATATMLSLYGLTTDRTGTYIAQFLGGTFMALAWISWYARTWPDDEPRRVLIRASFIASAIGLVVSLIFQLGPGSNASTWVFVVLTAIFAAGWGYYSYETMRSVTRPQPA
ncbi:MAG: hypothetical protein ACRDG6_12885 [Candidatus Limnocylindria bacterium]